MAREYFVGQVVRSADGHKLGKIVRREGDAFVIEKGVFFPKEYLVRADQVGDARGDEIWLNAQSTNLGASQDGREEKLESERARVGVHEEKLDVTKRVEEVGRVNIRKDVITERQEVSVPVLKEEVRVERIDMGSVDVSGSVGVGDKAFERESISVPIHEEQVDIRKRTVLKEEVRVNKDQRVEQRAASETIRKEVVDVEEEGRVEKSVDLGVGGYGAPGRDPDKY